GTPVGPARRPKPMSTLRHDAPHRPRGPSDRAGTARSKVLSVIVPAKDEAESLPQLVEEIVRAIRPLREGRELDDFEVLIVDDGSTDATPAVLRRLAASYPELRPIRLAANVGQSATAAGLRAAHGDWIATLDADLQNDPADL